MTTLLLTAAMAAAALVPAGSALRSGLAPPADSTQFVTWYEAIRDLTPDANRGSAVEGIVLERDVARFHLDRGTLHLLEPVEGRTFGAVFSGTGRFEMTVPDAIERRHLERAHDLPPEPVIDFRNAVFFFTDPTVTELEASLRWSVLQPPGDAVREVREAVEYVADGDGWIDPAVILPLINQLPGSFYAHFSESRGDPLIFTVDPLNAEEISLYGRHPREKRPSLMVRFHRQGDYSTGTSLPQEALDLLSISSYDIETDIDDGLDMVGRATARVTRRHPGLVWLPFRLYEELGVDSIRWGDGTAAPHYRPEDSPDLWVDFSAMPDDTAALTFYYRGEMMERPENLWVRMGSHTTWFPVYEAGRAIPYTLTFRSPERYVVTAVGERSSLATEDDRTTTVYETPPVRSVTFNIGEFETIESAPAQPGDPSLTVLLNEQAHRKLGGMVAEAGGYLLEQREMGEMVARDLRNSFTFFNDVFGPTTVREFVATEIPYSHGEAYPGLVMLAWNTFQWTADQGFDEMFRAHEVAHQWWGIGVRPATYRDWWLAEGFSEFSGLWYAARARGSVDLYLRRLRETRESILERRGESAPLALGTRAGSPAHPEDYQTTVYHKGAWVLHMLRTLMTDPETGSDELFTGMMQSFYNTHLGGAATTLDFQRTVEETLGGSMQWFFDAWVHGSDVPTYTFSHRYEEMADGSVLATVRVRQEHVPDDFRMIVPILIDFGEEGDAIVRIDVSGPVTEVQLPLLPRIPDRIELNPLESVLAETKTEEWRD